MKLKLSTVTIKLKLPIAALLLGAGLTACTSATGFKHRGRQHGVCTATTSPMRF